MTIRQRTETGEAAAWIGASLPRVEDRPLLTGTAIFVADLTRPNLLHARVVRSPVAHGVVRGVDVEAARNAAGVVAVLTPADVTAIPPIPVRMAHAPGLDPFLQPVLAQDRVRYVGEPIAVVVADDPYRAEDAAELVALDLDDLAPSLDTSVAEAGPPLFERGNVVATLESSFGDVDGAFVAADVTVALRLHVGRHTGVPLETRGLLAEIDPRDGRLTVYGAAKVPHWNRFCTAHMLGLAESQVHLVEVHVGGGFGVRGEFYPEDLLVPLLAWRLGRPVRWVEDRREHLVATNHSREQHHHIEVAAAMDGRILGVRDHFDVDMGAYIRTHGINLPNLTLSMLLGPYDVPAAHLVARAVLTNKTPIGTYRSPGRFEGNFVRESVVDEVAHAVGLDPAAVRRRNLIGPAQMPYTRPQVLIGTPVVLDSGDYPRLLTRVLERLDYANLRTELAAARATGRLIGVGLGFYVEKSGLGPREAVRVAVDGDGRVVVDTGVGSLGQGVETSLAQIVASVLGVHPNDVAVRHGDTDLLEDGFGAYATRVTAVTGPAAWLAASTVATQARAAAAGRLGVDASQLVLGDGCVHVTGEPDRGVRLGELATVTSLDALEWFEVEHMTYPYGCHAAVVEVDAQTRALTIHRYVIAFDVGRAVNPALVEAQLVGGFAQGLGGALLEEFHYDESGQPLATTFMDYLLPTAAEMPPLEVLVSEDAPSTVNPLGVKGAGEGGSAAVAAALANAIADATGERPTRTPLRP